MEKDVYFLNEIIDSVDTLISVIEFDTFKLIYLNESIKKRFNITEDFIGKKCYKILQKKEKPCENCPYSELKADPSLILTWEHIDATNNKILRKSARSIKHKGKYVHIEYAIDVTNVRDTEKENKKLKEKIEEIYIDQLTNLYNRRFLEEKISSELIYPLSVIMLDIDHFKVYNDTYGHQKGDLCLKQISSELHKIITRQGDSIIRYGGEEFLIILQNTDSDSAQQLANIILYNIRKLNIENEKTERKFVTVSIGVVTGKNNNIKNFIEKADKNLYVSKNTGRNKLTFSFIED